MTPLLDAFGFGAGLRVSAAVNATGVMAPSLGWCNGGADDTGIAVQLSTTTIGADIRGAGASEITGSTSSEEELYCTLSPITVSKGT